jgi:nucleoside-diphosphate-sugar epimerase
MRALITGATGLIGSHIAERLVAAGAEVRALARGGSDTERLAFLQKLGVELVRGDLADREAVLDAAVEGVDTIFHNAALVSDWGRWDDFAGVGIHGTRRLLEAAVADGVSRFVHMSSAAVYGLRRSFGRRVDEAQSLTPSPARWDYYARAKIEAERWVWRFDAAGEIGATVLRPTVVCGPRDRVVFPRIAALLRSGRLVVVGSGRNPIHVVYAGDVAEAAVEAASRDRAAGEAYNLDGRLDLTQRQAFDAVADLIGAPRPRFHVPRAVAHGAATASEVWAHARRRGSAPVFTRYMVDIAAGDADFEVGKAKRELGWEPRTPTLETLERAHEWSVDGAGGSGGQP